MYAMFLLGQNMFSFKLNLLRFIFMSCSVSFLDLLHAGGSYEFGYFHPSVRSSIANAFFSKSTHQFFEILCLKSGNHRGSKLMERDFSGRFVYFLKYGNGPKMSKK